MDLTELVDQRMVNEVDNESLETATWEGERGNPGMCPSARHIGKRDRSRCAGGDIDRDELVYSVNEADNYAVEEALQIRDRVGGNVTVVTVGGEDDDEERFFAES